MKRIIIYLFVTVWILLFSACTEDFEEMNKNPFYPTEVTIEPVFNSLMSTLLLGWQEQAGLHNTYYYYYNQQAGRFGISGYLLDNSINEMWSSYYRAFSNYRLLERLLEQYEGDKDLTNITAMGKILMAFKTLKMVEAFGDIPYFEAGNAVAGSESYRPVFDDQNEVYKACLTDLKWAADNLKEGDQNQFSVGDFDTVFGSNIKRWKKWANSLILRHALRIYDVEQQFAGDLISAVLGNATAYPLVEEGEDICLWPKELGLTLAGRRWSFESENMIRMGTAMWNVMSENDNTDGSGIFDPRCFVFFEPNDNEEWVPFPQNPTSSTPTEIIGLAYKGARNTNWEDKGGIKYSPFNFFLVYDIDDIPEFIQLAAEVNFLKAEAYAKGAGVSQDMAKAKTEYENGIKASVDFWYMIVEETSIWSHHIPPTPTTEEVNAFMARPEVAWNSTNALELIYTQRWIDAFRQPWEGLHLWNYTHMTPRDMSGGYNPSNYEFYRIHYPVDEQKYNLENWSAATNNGADDKESVKLFWHK